MTKFTIYLLLFFILITLSFHRNFELLGFIVYLPLFYLYEFFDVSRVKRKVIVLIFIFSYLHFLVLFWWLRHISIYAPVFLSVLLGAIRTFALFIPFLVSSALRSSKLLFYLSAGIIVERIIIFFIYPQPYLQANLIFVNFNYFFKPILLFSIIYQNIFLMLISYFIYSMCKFAFFRACLNSIEKINIGVVILLLILLYINELVSIEKDTKCNSKILNIAILQSNIAQYIKNEYKDRSQYILDRIGAQIAEVKKRKQRIDLVIGSETVFPYVVSYRNNGYKFLRIMRKKVGSDLLLGGFWQDDGGNVFNAAFLVTRTTIYVYKKVKLVVFGEYLPLGNIGFVKKIYDAFLPTKNFETLKNAKKFRIFKYKGLNIQPLICFEGFLEESYRGSKNVDLYVNLSNEGWYKDGLELYWGWNITKAMAVFSKTPIVRATNTGISGIHYHTPLLKSQPLQKGEQLINFEDILITQVCVNKGSVTLFDSIIYFITFCYLFSIYIFVIVLGIFIFMILIIFSIYKLFFRRS